MSITAVQNDTKRPASALVPDSGLDIRPADRRGKSDLGWLKSNFSFSFADYYDPNRMNFEALRVINDDWIKGGSGFPMHPHQDFEIFSYVLDGAIAHKDSMGNGSTVKAGGVQYMTAGSGVRHSEFNPNTDIATEMLQIWLMPKVRGANPRYEVRDLSPEEKAGQLTLFISEDGRDGTIKTLAPADIYAGTFDGSQSAEFDIREGRKGYIHVARGSLTINGRTLSRGDALTVSESGRLEISQGEDAEIILFDLEAITAARH